MESNEATSGPHVEAVPDGERPISGPTRAKPLRLLPGRLVPGTRYRLVRWLGEGGMGVVYEAEHMDLDRRVALKVLRAEHHLSARIAQKFRDEARAASRIGSDHIVDILDFGELPDGRLCYAMELLEGHNLSDEVEQAPMDPTRLIGILRQICKGLSTAHAAGIIHRDVKPENVFLTSRDGRADAVKLVDFGVARILTGDDATDIGAVGTPHYMAPEHCAGHDFDARLDMYALGCLAYELVVGRPPFVAPTVEEIMQAHLDRPPITPSQLDPPVEVPPPLEEIIMRCLAKAPRDRYEDMRDLEACLCEAQADLGLRTAWDDLPLPEVSIERLRRLARRMPAPGQPTEPERRGWLWPTAAVGSAVVAFGLGWTLLSGTPTEVDASAVPPQVERLAKEAQSAAAKAIWIYPPTTAPKTRTAYQKVLELEGLKDAMRDVANKRADVLRHEFADALSLLGDRLWIREGGRGFARDYYMQALIFVPDHPRASQRSGASPGQIAEARDKAASGRYTEAELETLQTLVELANDDVDALVERYRKRSTGSVAEGTALRQLLRGMGRDPVRAGTTGGPTGDPAATGTGGTTDAGTGGTGGGTTGGADTAADTAPPPIPVRRPSGSRPAPGLPIPDEEPVRPTDPEASADYVKRARAALRRGSLKEAETQFHRAISEDPTNAEARMGLGDIFFERGNYSLAVKFAKMAVDASPANAEYRIRLGDSYYKVLRYEEARVQYSRAEQLGHPDAAERLAKIEGKLGTPTAPPPLD